jgi:hypothetical protein
MPRGFVDGGCVSTFAAAQPPDPREWRSNNLSPSPHRFLESEWHSLKPAEECNSSTSLEKRRDVVYLAGHDDGRIRPRDEVPDLVGPGSIASNDASNACRR